MGELPPSYRKALEHLATVPWATPADIGYAVCPVRPSGFALKAQGAGRMGGQIASRLRKLGLAAIDIQARGGFPAYRITKAGREALPAPKADVSGGGV